VLQVRIERLRSPSNVPKISGVTFQLVALELSIRGGKPARVRRGSLRYGTGDQGVTLPNLPKIGVDRPGLEGLCDSTPCPGGFDGGGTEASRVTSPTTDPLDQPTRCIPKGR